MNKSLKIIQDLLVMFVGAFLVLSGLVYSLIVVLTPIAILMIAYFLYKMA